MTPRTEFPAAVSFRTGQRLAADDLSAALAAEARHRALHVRVLHDTWGVAEGLEVLPTLSRSVQVRPGLAYDFLGRELYLRDEVTLPLPAANAPGGWMLVLRADDSPPVRAEGGCLPGGRVGGRSSGRLAWRAPKEVRAGAEVPLARVLLFHGFPLVGSSAGARAQPARRPHVGWGLVTVPPDTWAAWPAAGPVGFEAPVETSVAGFTGAPLYFVQPVATDKVAGPPGNAVGPFVSVAGATAEGFTIRLVWPVSDAAAWPDAALRAVIKDWQWFWIGVEVSSPGGG